MTYDPRYQPQQYPQNPQFPQQYPQYPPQQPYYGQPPRSQSTNTWAILALILAFTAAPLGAIAGHVALSQIKRTGEQGRVMAILGLVFGYLFTALYVVSIGAIIWLQYFLAESIDTSYDYSAAATSSLAVLHVQRPLGLSGV